MVSKIRRKRRGVGRVSGFPLEAKDVVAHSNGLHPAALRSAADLRIVDWPGAFHLFVVLNHQHLCYRIRVAMKYSSVVRLRSTLHEPYRKISRQAYFWTACP